MSEDSCVPMGDPSIVVGVTVEWVPADAHIRGLFPFLTAGHPGVVTWSVQDMAMVDWMNKEGVANLDSVFQHAWLNVLSVAEFERRSKDLRASSWPGVPRDGRYWHGP